MPAERRRRPYKPAGGWMDGFGAGVDPMAGYASGNIDAHSKLADAFAAPGVQVSIVGHDALDDDVEGEE